MERVRKIKSGQDNTHTLTGHPSNFDYVQISGSDELHL